MFSRQYLWPTGATLKVAFVDGSQEARKAVATTAQQWTEHANLTFDFHFGSPPPGTDILIRFNHPGCTSALGKNSRYRAERGEPSMHLCHKDKELGTDRFQRIVLHEFGHAIGLEHEHQSPSSNTEWNKEAVYQYYATYGGWTREYVDQWVFRTIDPETVIASDYDPDSVMHYFYPPEFTRSGVAFGGKHELSELDKALAKEVYPGRGTTTPTRRHQRKLAVRNKTGQTIDVRAIYEGASGGSWTWHPGDRVADGAETRIPKGAERVLDGPGRKAKLIATSVDGRKTWSSWAKVPVQLAPKEGYLDTEIQTYVVTIDGPADAPKTQTKAELFESGMEAMDGGEHSDARVLFERFVDQYPNDDLVPWALFNIAVSFYEERLYEDALYASYDLIVAHPRADASAYAWYYGGLASVGIGWCEGAESYFGYAAGERSGLPDAWRNAAQEYLDAVAADPDRWCSSE